MLQNLFVLQQYVCGKTWCVEILASSTLKTLSFKKDASLLYKRRAIKIACIFPEFLWRLVVKINRYFYFIVYIVLLICTCFWKLCALIVLWETSTASIISNHSSILQSWIIKHLLWPHYLCKIKKVYISILKTKIKI